MPQNLRARLARIRNVKGPDRLEAAKQDEGFREQIPETTLKSADSRREGWQEVGCKILGRTLTLPFTLPAVLPFTLPWLIPDLIRSGTSAHLPGPDRFLFFDLETTGLSGGAGTVAFLAAFGHFVRAPEEVPDGTTQADYTALEITQFLLLDYPGEPDFLERVLSFISTHAASNPYFLTTYNGKAFDTQILRTRSLLNGMTIPLFFQADLLHPARRLWKRILPNCSQATVETLALGLDRSGDTPGSLAPDIWFDFLRSGDTIPPETETEQASEPCRALLNICDHNVKDILGLASLLRTFIEIAASPLDAAARFHCDEENLAINWSRNVRYGSSDQKKIADLLLETAAKSYPRSCIRQGFDLFRKGNCEKARANLLRIGTETAWKVPCTVTLQALALRSLAIDAERRLEQRDLALAYIEQALNLAASLPGGLRGDLERRQKRLNTLLRYTGQ